MKITELSLNKPVSVIVLTLSVYVLGVLALFTMPVNLLPTVVYPLVKVNISWRGATPEDVENQIAEVVEQKVATVDNLDYISATCMDGAYELLVYFDFNADRDVAYQDVMAKMGIVRKSLPKDADEPTIIKADPSQMPVMDLLITSDGYWRSGKTVKSKDGADTALAECPQVKDVLVVKRLGSNGVRELA